MDTDVSVLLECSVWRGLVESQVQVELSESYNRQTDAALELHIEEVWRERITREPWLFNGAKFRLQSFSLTPPKSPHSSTCCPCKHLPCSPSNPGLRSNFADDMDAKERRFQKGEGNLWDNHFQQSTCPQYQQGNGDSAHQFICGLAGEKQVMGSLVKDSATSICNLSGGSVAHLPSQPATGNPDLRETSPILTLRLGLTCYKDFLGTNWSHHAEDLCRRGEAEFGDHCALLAQPLGVGGVLCTRDGKVVLIRRSQRVAEAGGLLDIPGGHPEPQAVCECVSGGVCQEGTSMAVLQQSPEAVVAELFSSVCTEIRDEVNVQLSSLGEPVLMGIALNHTSAGRPSAEFYVSCSLTSDEVRELYWRGGVEANESTDVVFLSKKEVFQLNSSAPLWSELCPSAKGAVLLYQHVMPDG